MTGRETWQNRLHVAVAVLCAWLIGTSPWVVMLRRIPGDAGFLDYGHVVAGVIAAVAALAYFTISVVGGRWRSLFPWLAADVQPMARDTVGLFRGRLPTAEGGGLFAAIEGLLLLALLAVAATGVTWLFLQGTDAAVTWREVHGIAARLLTGLAVAHVLAVASHLRELA